MIEQKIFIEALCYARWDNSGFSWRTTLNENATDDILCIVEDVQKSWEQIDVKKLLNDEQYVVWVQSENLEFVHCGLICKDKDENNRTTHRKEIWIFDKNSWQNLGANAAFLWEDSSWFTIDNFTDQAENFMEKSFDKKSEVYQDLKAKDYVSIQFRPEWLSGFVLEFLSDCDNKTVIVPTSDHEVIFPILRMLPDKLRLRCQSIFISWQESLAHLEADFNIVFCKPEKLDEVKNYHKLYGDVKLVGNETNEVAEKIIQSMLSNDPGKLDIDNLFLEKEAEPSVQQKPVSSVCHLEEPHRSKSYKVYWVIAILLLIIVLGIMRINSLNKELIKKDSGIKKQKQDLKSKTQTPNLNSKNKNSRK